MTQGGEGGSEQASERKWETHAAYRIPRRIFSCLRMRAVEVACQKLGTPQFVELLYQNVGCRDKMFSVDTIPPSPCDK